MAIDALLVSSPINIAYLTGFAGFSKDEREAYLVQPHSPTPGVDAQNPWGFQGLTHKTLVQPQGLTHKTPGVFGYLLTDSRYFEEARKVIKNFEIVEISSSNQLYEELKKIIKKEKLKRLGFEKNSLTVGELEKIKRAMQGIKNVILVPAENIVEDLRIIKKPEEIEKIEKACGLDDKAFNYIKTKIKPGISEKQLAFELEFFIKRKGADISFPPIVAFGSNSAIPHHQTSNKQLATRELVLIDFGVKLDNYCSDMTRVVFLGKATREQKKVYQTVLDAQKLAVKHLGGGRMDSSEVDRFVRNYIISQDFPPIPHGLGHGVGLEIHEKPRLSPRSTDILKPGMVFSLEPGIYIPNKFGIRIEDLVLLTETGPKFLTYSTREIIEL